MRENPHMNNNNSTCRTHTLKTQQYFPYSMKNKKRVNLTSLLKLSKLNDSYL